MNKEHTNKVFISYSSRDYRNADKQIIPGNPISEIVKALNDNNIDKWIDSEGLLSGRRWTSQIKEAIERCNILLFVASENSNKSENTANEIVYALSLHKHIIIFRVDESHLHEDVDFNFSLQHQLLYYNDRNKALADLIASIKKIKTDAVVSYNKATLDQDFKEEPINGEFLSRRVLSIFNAPNMEEASSSFLFFYDLLCTREKGHKTLKEQLDNLSSISNEHNPDVKRTRIINLIAKIKDNNSVTERHVQLLSILLKMYLYYLLSDIKEVYEIQKEIDSVDFQTTFFEDNSEVINDVTDGIVRIGGFLASTIAVFMGKGGQLAESAMIATSRSKKVNVVKTAQEISSLKQSFHALKTAISGLRF